VLRCCCEDICEGPSDELAALPGGPLPSDLLALFWGSDSFVDGDEQVFGPMLMRLMANKEAEAWPQLSSAPLSRAACWRALFALLAERASWCPALLRLGAFLPTKPVPKPLQIVFPPDAVPLSGGPLYAGLGLTSRPRFGGKDGE
jgi:hypothetical protein